MKRWRYPYFETEAQEGVQLCVCTVGRFSANPREWLGSPDSAIVNAEVSVARTRTAPQMLEVMRKTIR